MISPLNMPVNPFICKGDGTIFSSGSGSSGSTDSNLTFKNIGDPNGAKVLAGRILDEVQFKPLLQGKNVGLTDQADGIKIEVDDLEFDSTTPVKRNISGLQGITLGGMTVLQTLQELLYPTIAPGASLLLAPPTFEIGNSDILKGIWTATKTDEPITGVSVNNVSQTVDGNTQGGQVNITKTGLANVIVPMQVSTATKVVNITATAFVTRLLRYGDSLKDGIIVPILDTDINGLGFKASSTYQLSPVQLTIGSQSYLMIAIAKALLGSNTPVFKINGFINTAFNLVRTNAFVNTHGYSDLTNVYVSQSFATGSIQLEIA